jgi:hypothetical protein
MFMMNLSTRLLVILSVLLFTAMWGTLAICRLKVGENIAPVHVRLVSAQECILEAADVTLTSLWGGTFILERSKLRKDVWSAGDCGSRPVSAIHLILPAQLTIDNLFVEYTFGSVDAITWKRVTPKMAGLSDGNNRFQLALPAEGSFFIGKYRNMLNWKGDFWLLFPPFVETLCLFMIGRGYLILFRNHTSMQPVKVSEFFKSNGCLQVNSDFAPVCFTIFASLGFMSLLVLAVAEWYHPDTAHQIHEATALVVPSVSKFLAPEPVERLQYVLSVIFTPLFVWGCLLALRRSYQGTTDRHRRFLTWLATALLFTGTLALPVLAYQALKTSSFLYVGAGVLVTNFPLYTLLLFPGAVLLVFFADQQWISRLGIIATCSISVYVAMIVFFTTLFDHDNLLLPYRHHLNPVVYPLAQVMAGKTLLVSCAPLYGLYPHFLQPVFQLFPLSVYSFTITMGGLMLVCFSALWFFLWSVTRNNFVFFAGFVAAAFYADGVKVIFAEPYFQYAPIRMLFPCLLLALAALYLQGIGGRRVYCATFLCAALATLWNLDTGVVVFVSWLLLLGYTELFRNSWRASIRPILFHAITACGALLLTWGGFAGFAFLRSGAWPDWRLSIIYYKLFSYYGFNMLPMPDLPHAWGLIVVVYVVAMVLALHGLLRKKHELFCGCLFLLSVLGSGLFAYYQGRSHNLCLIPLVYVPISIITLIADHIFTGVKQGSRAYYKFLPLGALCFYFCASAVPSLFTQSTRFIRDIYEGSRATSAGSQGLHSQNIEFIRKLTKPGERIFILLNGDVDGMYYAETATASVLDLPSSTDWFFMADFDKLEQFLRDNKSTKLFTVPGQRPDMAALFKKSYRLVAQDSQTGLALFLPTADAKPDGSPHP